MIPIDRLTDVRAPTEVIARRIPRRVLEAAYGTQLPRPGAGEDPDRCLISPHSSGKTLHVPLGRFLEIFEATCMRLSLVWPRLPCLCICGMAQGNRRRCPGLRWVAAPWASPPLLRVVAMKYPINCSTMLTVCASCDASADGLVHLPSCRPPSAAELLRGVAGARGWVVGSGLPDEARAGRLLLKDYTDGRLVYCEWPPSAADLQEEPSAAAHEEGNEAPEGEDDEDDEPANSASRHAEAGTSQEEVEDGESEDDDQPGTSSSGDSDGETAAEQSGRQHGAGAPEARASAVSSSRAQRGGDAQDLSAAAPDPGGSAPSVSAAGVPFGGNFALQDVISELGDADLDLLQSINPLFSALGEHLVTAK